MKKHGSNQGTGLPIAAVFLCFSAGVAGPDRSGPLRAIRSQHQMAQGARMGRETKPFASASANSFFAGSYFMFRLSHMQMLAA